MTTIPDRPTTVCIHADVHNYGNRYGASITGIVLHATQGWRAGVTAKFLDKDAQASCHYMVCQDGTLIQYVNDGYSAWHAGNGDVNKHTIGIELEAIVQDLKTREWLVPPKGFTEDQYKTLIQLLRYLIAVYGIKVEKRERADFSNIGLMAHSDVPDPHHEGQWGGSNHHEDPGPQFPWWERLLNDLQPQPLDMV